jgi:sialic acid synthase SpsE
MATLRDAFDIPVGWSDHTEGIDVAVAAVAAGAQMIEKHFTLDRTLPGPDHAASLEPGELVRMVERIRNVEVVLGDGLKQPTEGELKVARVARRSLHAARDLQAGHVLADEDLVLLRPGTGLPAAALQGLVGRPVTRPLRVGQMLQETDVD